MRMGSRQLLLVTLFLMFALRRLGCEGKLSTRSPSQRTEARWLESSNLSCRRGLGLAVGRGCWELEGAYLSTLGRRSEFAAVTCHVF